MLQPVDASAFMDDELHKMMSMLYSISPNYQKYLPMKLADASEVKNTLFGDCMATEMGLRFSYLLKLNAAICGYILVHTPEYNKQTINYPHWSIDFALFSVLEGKGIMSSVLSHLLFFLKEEIGVDYLYAIVADTNIRCLNLLKHFPFDKTDDVLNDPNTGDTATAYCCPLVHVNFR